MVTLKQWYYYPLTLCNFGFDSDTQNFNFSLVKHTDYPSVFYAGPTGNYSI